MIVRFGYVAMSVHVKNASPSKTMTWTQFNKIADREAAVRKLERIAEENLHNTLRLLRHNKAHDIQVYRFSSRLIPLLGHEGLGDWNPIRRLQPFFAPIGEFVRANGMRVSFHPDHYTVISTPREDIYRKSVHDLDRHVQMLEAMGLGRDAKLNIHIGGTYGDKEKTIERFLRQFIAMDQRIRQRITLENDDKTFTAEETLLAAEALRVPMVLDVHHHAVNHHETELYDLWPRIRQTWEFAQEKSGTPLPPKIHVSSPKSERDPRGHADYVEFDPLFSFLRNIAASTPALDIMIEAKMKDGALLRLMEQCIGIAGVEPISQAAVNINDD